MLRIEIAGQTIDLNPETSISWELINPMFGDTGSHSWTINIPPTDHNKKVFGWPNRPNSPAVKDFQCTLYHSGIHIFSGIATISEASGKMFQVFFKVGNGDFFYQIKDKMLSSVNWGAPITLGASVSAALDYYKNAALNSYPEYAFVAFPIHNKEFMKDSTDATYTAYKTNHFIQNYFISNAYPEYLDSPYNLRRNIMIPFFYVTWILDKIFSNFGFTISYSVFHENYELRSLVLYNIQAANHAGGMFYNLEIEPGSHIPDAKISDFLNSLRKFFAVEFVVNHKDRTVRIIDKNSILNSYDVLDVTSRIITQPSFKPKVYKGVKFVMKPDSNDAFAQYSKLLTNLTRLADAASYAALPTGTEGDVCFVTDERVFYAWKWDEVAGVTHWTFFATEIIPEYLSSSETDETQETEASSVFNNYPEFEDWTTLGAGRGILLPKAEQYGRLMYFTSKKNTCSTRFLFYRGMRTDENGASYPLGSYGTKNFAGTQIANYSLCWDGDKGLINSFWQKYIDWVTTVKREAEAQLTFTAAELAMLDISQKISIDNSNYVITKLKINFSNKRISIATIELFKA